jgi:outer membrane murein-binding lipoprotein Lpp
LSNSKIGALIILSLVVAGISNISSQNTTLQRAAAQSSYLDEFSIPGEQVQWLGRWLYSTYSGQDKFVEVYAYCTVVDCTVVAFDITNQTPLYDYEAVSFFENYAISKLIFSTDIYKDPFSSSSVCDSMVPSLRADMTNLVIKATESGAGKLMSESEVKYLKTGTKLARTLGFVGDLNLLTFGFAAVCLGSNLFEKSIADDITKCYDFIKASKAGYISQSRAYDIILCNENLAKRLQDAKLSPGVFLKNLEILGKNFLSTLNCIGSRDACTPPQRLVTAVIDDMIPAVKAIASEVREAIKYAPQDAARSNERITQKYLEASTLIQELDGEYHSMNGQVENHRWLNIIRDWFYTPQYDLLGIEQSASVATRHHNEAHANLSAYKLNSAIAAAKQGLQYSKEASLVVSGQEDVERKVDAVKLLIISIPPIAAIGALIFFRTRGKP